MESRLKIKTKSDQEVDAVAEPVSPTGLYFNSNSLSVCILGVLEFATPIDDSSTMPLLRDVFLPINPRFSSIMTGNAVLTGIIAFGARLYMNEIGTEFCKSRTTALVLFNTRNTKGYMSVQEMLTADNKIWGNQFAFLHVALPELTTFKSSNPLEFVLEAHQSILRMKSSPSVYLTGRLLEIMRKCRGPEAVAQHLQSTIKKSSFGITSLIGPVEEMAIANHPVKGLYFIPLGVPHSLIISILSYMRTLRIGIAVEEDFIDMQKFISCLENASQLIYKAVTETV